ncbi:hypothetical protein LX36DRAFT_666781 [Colletotrichum falcatum]|nr:hypothetical protein LX36DRAFT_666781 [Colletotrichum falcatum]
MTQAVEIGAVVPTATGQIGVDPVSVLQPASKLADDSLGDHHSRSLFSATTNAAGDIDISIINPALKSFLESAAEDVPACGLKRRAYCGARYFVNEFETHFDKSVQAVQDLEDAIIEGAPKHPIKIEMEKAIDLTNTEGEADGVPDVAFSIMSEDEVTGFEAGAPAVIGPLGVGFLAYAFYVNSAMNNAGTVQPVITGLHVPSAPLKAVKQTQRPTKTATVLTVSSSSTLACPDPTESPPTCKSGQHKGCDCVLPTYFEDVIISKDELEDTENMQKIFKPLPKKFPKLPKYRECSKMIGNMDPKLFKPFTSNWKMSEETKCTNQCRQIFDGGFTTSTLCTCDSHTMDHNGTFSLDSGTASFEIFNPDTASSGPWCKSTATEIPYNNPKWGLRMVVDSKGTSRIPNPQLHKRTPPANQSTWLDYNFDLRFKPETGAEAGAECKVTCEDAFAAFPASKCGQNGGQGNSMARYGEYEAGCGKFSYQITKVTPSKLGAQKCYETNNFGKHEDVSKDFQKQYIGWACVETALPKNKIRKGDKSSFIHWNTTTNRVLYQYNIYWADGCSLDNGQGEASPAQPLEEDKKSTCTNLLIGDYENCNNGGVGGSIQAGCVVYNFKASKA